MLKFFRFNYCKALFFNPQKTYFYQTEKLFKDLNENELKDNFKLNQILEKTFPGKTNRSQRGLFHKKQPKTGNQTCFSEKKSRRWWKPNIFKKVFTSDLLERKLKLEVSSKAFKTIRKYGGIDNYILLTKPKNMDSIYGEYLRKIMYSKISNLGDFEFGYIAKSREIKKKSRKRSRYNIKRTVWHPKDQRHIDLSHLRVKSLHEMTKSELLEIEELAVDDEKVLEHPAYLKNLEEEAEDLKILEPERQKVLKMYEKKYDENLRMRIAEDSEKASKFLSTTENPLTEKVRKKTLKIKKKGK